MTYVDGFMAPVAAGKREEFTRFAKEAAKIFKENGALQVVDCWSNDVPEGKVTSMHMAVQRKGDEAIAFGWVLWPSKDVRDSGMQKVMGDSRMQAMGMPFDGPRAIFGGFEVVSSS
ncbi:MAG: DUF1428 domain-containing protein [Pseudomonadota bacterium]|nr:DUF1428 domain-containing protein [Pseudomonadota bacterium]